jgi:diamine N-acetyltransferase
MPIDTSGPFAAPSHRLPGGDDLSLQPIDLAAACHLATALVAVDPWRTLGSDAGKLADYLMAKDPHCHRRLICHGGEMAGVVAIRDPWLYGPYLALLAVLPKHQRSGIGSTVLGWMEGQARALADNMWVCVSSFNVRAQHFYQRHGFVCVADLDALVHPEHSERLLRKRFL